MKRRPGTDRFITSHVGSLPRPDDLIEFERRRFDGEPYDEEAYLRRLREATVDVVQRQLDAGIVLPNDGEYGHPMAIRVDYGAWWHYAFRRLGGLGEWGDLASLPFAPPASGLQLSSMMERRDQSLFPDLYAGLFATGGVGMKSSSAADSGGMGIPVCTGPLSYQGDEDLQRQIGNLRAALEKTGAEQGFLCAIGPGSLSRIGNAYYKTDEEFVWAVAEAMRTEYQAITDAGLIVQIDEPSFAENWDQFNPEPAVADYQAFTMVRVEALNHALRGIPRERVRFHCCWGSWHGPHTTDLGLEHLVGLLLRINAGTFSFEAANARHEHEWRVWEDVKLPDGVALMPGVVSQTTHVVEHPVLVADRIERFARLVGRKNVIPGTDCGMGGRLHPDLAWAKLESLGAGARLAAERT
jgi:5-methyltetrahydropteroyltriglutamate--homocysteine methyltransferase